MSTLTVEDANGVVRVTLGQISAGPPPDYGLKVVSSDGSTTIIDGTSDVFKIVASGTLTTSGAGNGQSQSAVTLTTGITVIPTCLIWQEFLDAGTSQNAGQQVNALVINLTSGAIAFMYEGWAELTATPGQTRVVVQTTATPIGAGGRAGTYRYYVMQETAF